MNHPTNFCNIFKGLWKHQSINWKQLPSFPLHVQPPAAQTSSLCLWPIHGGLISGRPAAIQIHAWMLPSLRLLAPPTQPLNICPWGSAYPVDVTSTSSQMESPSQQAAGHFCRFSQGTEDKLFHPRPHLSCKPTLCCPHPQRVSTQTRHLLLGKSWFFLLFHLPCPEHLTVRQRIPISGMQFKKQKLVAFPLPDSVTDVYTIGEYFLPSA